MEIVQYRELTEFTIRQKHIQKARPFLIGLQALGFTFTRKPGEEDITGLTFERTQVGDLRDWERIFTQLASTIEPGSRLVYIEEEGEDEWSAPIPIGHTFAYRFTGQTWRKQVIQVSFLDVEGDRGGVRDDEWVPEEHVPALRCPNCGSTNPRQWMWVQYTRVNYPVVRIAARVVEVKTDGQIEYESVLGEHLRCECGGEIDRHNLEIVYV